MSGGGEMKAKGKRTVGACNRTSTRLPRGPLRAASPLPSATYPPLRSGAFRQRPSCERNPHLAQLGRWPLARVAFCGGCSSALLGLRAPLRPFRETGATRAAYAVQKRARHFRRKQVRPKSAALAFPPLAGVAPYSKRGTMPRTIYRRTGWWLASRGLRLFSPDGENRSPRGGGNRDTAPHDDRTRGGAAGR